MQELSCLSAALCAHLCYVADGFVSAACALQPSVTPLEAFDIPGNRMRVRLIVDLL